MNCFWFNPGSLVESIVLTRTVETFEFRDSLREAEDSMFIMYEVHRVLADGVATPLYFGAKASLLSESNCEEILCTLTT